MTALSTHQRGVLCGMAAGAVVAVVVVWGGAFVDLFGPFDNDLATRLSIASGASLLPALCLMFALGRIAKHRFFHAVDIDGAGLSEGTPRVQLLRALAQNTHEQVMLAVVAYFAWVLLMPIGTLSAVVLAAIVFVLGRILFFAGYARGAPARSLGFTACFYPTALMLATVAVMRALRWLFG
ncbi:membrane-associated protein in eicosanoid and glutathione metabolism [Salinisphaera sp. S4-8]|uniref:MAPEG family protein n=1 Tax=Salinisphaera sp. S4-8 TaxID=633357 RepID=UPI00333F6C80